MHQQAKLDDVPNIEGIVFRGFRGKVDYPGIVAILEGSKEFDQIKQTNTLEDMQRTYSHLVNCDPFQDMLLAEAEGEAIAYCRVFWEQQIEGDRVYFHFGTVLPEWRRKGIGRAMLRWCKITSTSVKTKNTAASAAIPKTSACGVLGATADLRGRSLRRASIS